MLIPLEGFNGDENPAPRIAIDDDETIITDEDFDWVIEWFASYDDTFGTEILPWLLWAIPPEDYMRGAR